MIPPLNGIRNRLRFRQLALIEALAEHGSLSKAAEQVGLTQPAATRLIHEAEGAFGLKLFERMPYGMQPTVYGRAVIEFTRRLSSDLAGLRSELVAFEGGSSGRVNVGAIVAAVPGLFAAVQGWLAERELGLLVNLQVDTSDILIQALQLDKLDVVIGRIPAEIDHEGLRYEPLFEEELVIVSNRRHHYAERSEVDIAELRDCPWVLQPYPSPMRYLADNLFRDARVEPPKCHFETSSTLAALDLIAENDTLLAMIPLAVAQRFTVSGFLHILPATLGIRLSPYGIITRDRRIQTVATRCFIEGVHAVGHKTALKERLTENGMAP